MTEPSPLVFFDIAGPDSRVLSDFYSTVFGWEAGDDGQLSPPLATPVKAAIREDPAEKRLYIGVDDVTATLERIQAQGGSVDQPRFEVPGLVVLGLFRDPAGNPMGLVEMQDGRPRVP